MKCYWCGISVTEQDSDIVTLGDVLKRNADKKKYICCNGCKRAMEGPIMFLEEKDETK